MKGRQINACSSSADCCISPTPVCKSVFSNSLMHLTDKNKNAGFSCFRQSACHWSRPCLQSPMKSQASKSASWESAHQVASFWKGVSWAAVSSRFSLTLWPPRDTPLKNSSSSRPSLEEMWVVCLLSYRHVRAEIASLLLFYCKVRMQNRKTAFSFKSLLDLKEQATVPLWI